MVTGEILIKFGLTNDESKSKLKEIFKNNTKLKEIHIDIYQENPLITSITPFMLLLRTIEKNVVVSNDEERLILMRNDEYNTHFINVLFSEIKECYHRDIYGVSEFVLNIQNIHYKITVLN